MKAVFIFFSLLYVAGGIFVALISGLSSNYAPKVGLAYAVLGIPILGLIYFFLNRIKINHKSILFSGIALIVLFLGYPILGIEGYRVEQTVSKTKVWDVRDEMFFSKKGNPLGISLRYKLQMPKNAYYGEQGGPSFAELYPENAYFYGGDFFMQQAITFNKKALPEESSKDSVVYEVTTELLPHFLAYNDEKKNGV